MSIIAASRLRASVPNLFNGSEAYYKCDGNTSGVLLDSKNSFNGTLSGGITQGVTGKIGLAVESDGTGNSHLSIPHETFDERNFSLSFWMYYSSNFSEIIINVRSAGSGLYVKFNNNILLVYQGVASVFNVSSDLVLNSWNQVIIQRLNESAIVFINNSLKGSGSSRYENSFGTDLFFGADLDSGGIPRNGRSQSFLLDEIDIRKEQYTQQQRDELYNNGNGTTI
jgi:hypothetical protein